MTFRKSDVVTIRTDLPYQTRSLRRQINDADRKAWRDSDESKGMTCDGETKLQWPTTGRELQEGEVLKVVRGRARFSVNWGNPTSGWTKVVAADEQEYFVRTVALVHV